MPVKLQNIIHNAIQIFHIDHCKPSNLEPGYIVNQVHQLLEKLLAVLGDDELSRKCGPPTPAGTPAMIINYMYDTPCMLVLMLLYCLYHIKVGICGIQGWPEGLWVC
ncbi:hypothetical protein M404DRAFT_21127 [Pisolithus tinctorius Marx 270]|uniref:RNA polymerase Rpb1 domain-containing protein n=1 Tax=Pisolithus tinctorius Marx 270 TaxID=870435 RepID=A0A0C3PQU9_PISTI|nr:hypothetical protein M404DRAFT_21127 [Pisolithus tinctorius Marx 270]